MTEQSSLSQVDSSTAVQKGTRPDPASAVWPAGSPAPHRWSRRPLQRGRRDFASVVMTHPQLFDVVVNDEVADEAARLLGTGV